MSKYDLTGKILLVNATKAISDRFSKREFVVETNDNPRYPQQVMLEATGDAIASLDGLHVGDEVRVDFNVRGREWKSPSGEVKYFNTLNAWKIETTKQVSVKPSTGSGAAPGTAPIDDVPFASCDIAHEPGPIARVLR